MYFATSRHTGNVVCWFLLSVHWMLRCQASEAHLGWRCRWLSINAFLSGLCITEEIGCKKLKVPKCYQLIWPLWHDTHGGWYTTPSICGRKTGTIRPSWNQWGFTLLNMQTSILSCCHLCWILPQRIAFIYKDECQKLLTSHCSHCRLIAC